MSEKLKDYQVLDVLCGGTFYKVRHKVTNNIFAWKAYDCSAYSDEQIQNVISEVKLIKNVQSMSLLRYYDTILHGPSKTLYIVLEYNSWQSLKELTTLCKATDKHLVEGFVWYLLFELARVCKAVEPLRCLTLKQCVCVASVFVSERCELRINCFDLAPTAPVQDVMRQVGEVIYTLCYHVDPSEDKIKEFHYSSDLQDVLSFLTDEKNTNLRPDVVLYHPTVLANLESFTGARHLCDILVSDQMTRLAAEVNKCDSDKAVELCKIIEPAPRTHFHTDDSPIYSNITPKHKANHNQDVKDTILKQGPLSPTLAALALELPGFVPRSRKPYNQALERYDPQKVSEETLSQQWMSRLIALRHREESLNKRERDLIAKEIVNSPAVKVIALSESLEDCGRDSNGITLPPIIQQTEESGVRTSRNRRRRADSLRPRRRRKSYAYEDLDSSLSADPGDESFIITATKFTQENLPRRNIFPSVSSKKVHFTPANPFTESDESVTLTFYELDNMGKNGHQMLQKEETVLKDIHKFKYLDIEKLTSEKRAAMQVLSQSSPSKQAKMGKPIFSDITNINGIRKSPSKSSLTSKCSNSSRYSMASCKSHWSMESTDSKMCKGNVADRTRASIKQSAAHTPAKPLEVKKSRRRSLLPFKTPFKFMTSTKI